MGAIPHEVYCSDFYFVFISIITTSLVNKLCVFIVERRNCGDFSMIGSSDTWRRLGLGRKKGQRGPTSWGGGQKQAFHF